MPHFRWRGVTIEGKWRYGRSCEPSREKLDARLLARGIACTHAKMVRPYLMRPAISIVEQAQSLETIALLLNAGMKVPEAFIVTAETVANPVLQEFFIILAVAIDQGHDFDDYALRGVFNPLIIHLMQVGYKSGTLAKILPSCATFLQSAHDIRKRMRTMLIMPIVTLLFVFFLLWAIFVFLVPSLTVLFNQLQTDLPSTTKTLLVISSWMCDTTVLIIICMSIGCVSLVTYFLHTYGFLVRLYAALPGIGSLYMQWQRIMFIRSLAALLDGGMQVTDALRVLVDLTPSSYTRTLIMYLTREVVGGVQLSDALASIDSPLSTPLMVALVIVGQESNALSKTLDAAAQRESALFLGTLQTITVIIQPILILTLGIVVLMVIASVYMPLISIAHVI